MTEEERVAKNVLRHRSQNDITKRKTSSSAYSIQDLVKMVQAYDENTFDELQIIHSDFIQIGIPRR